MSSLTCINDDLKEQSQMKLTLKMEDFIEEYASLIWLLSIIFIVSVGMILTNSQLCILLCSSYRDPNDLWPEGSFSVDYLVYDGYTKNSDITASESSSITNGYVRNSQHFIIHLAADSEHWN